MSELCGPHGALTWVSVLLLYLRQVVCSDVKEAYQAASYKPR